MASRDATVMLRPAEAINLTYFALLVGLAYVFRLGRLRTLQVAAMGAAGSLLVLGGVAAGEMLEPERGWWLRDWLPAPVLLIAYWQAGRFFIQPHTSFQAALKRIDGRVQVLLSGWGGLVRCGVVMRYLETVYLLAYPLVPLGLATLYLFGYDDYADHFWSVVLPSAYICYLALPFLPTLPPRLQRVDGADAFGNRAPGRGANLWILDRMGVGANTFPSGHVAATFATALVVWELVPPAGYLFLVVSSSIALSVVVRRYHYLADAVLGLLLALSVWLLIRTISGGS